MKTWFGIVALFGLLSYYASATEKDLYNFKWLDPDKSVYVLQNKVYKKEKSFYADFSLLKGLSSTYQDTKGFDIKTGYYFHEEWGLELYFTNYYHTNNENFKNVQSVNGSVPFIRHISDAKGALVIWSPFYGKINTFNRIYYFDLSFGAGYAKLGAASNLESVKNPQMPDQYNKESFDAGVFKGELRFYISKKVHLGLELRNSFYKAPSALNPTHKGIKTNTDALINIGISF